MKKESALAYVGHNSRGDREENDFYPTPETATEALLKKQKFEGNIWECACGDGAISKVLLKHGYKVYSSDLIDRGYGSTGKDFLNSDLKADNIVTNPPFNLAGIPLSLHRATNNLAFPLQDALFCSKAVKALVRSRIGAEGILYT